MEPIWWVPLMLGTTGLVVFLSAWLLSIRFDRRHPHLSRKGLLEREALERSSPERTRRPPIPVPPFHPEQWRMESARDELESERFDRSLSRWGEQVARHPHRSDARASAQQRRF